MKQLRITVFVTAVALVAMLGVPALAGEQGNFKAVLNGFAEVVAVSTEASGQFEARISEDEDSVDYELSYEDLEGTVTQAHIHFGKATEAGGISVFLCQTTGAPDPTALAPTCPQSGTVSGTFTAVNVMGPAAQGIAAGEFAELLDALRSGVTYVNVHSSKFTGGEIRGQIGKGKKGKGG